MNAKPQITDGASTDEEARLNAAPSARLLRLPEVMDRVGLRRSSIYQRMSEGRFPKSRSLGPKCAVWVEAEINDWIQSIAQNSSRADP